MKTRASPRARGLHLYQARTRKAWHDELKSGHFFNLTKLSEKKMNPYRKEVDAKHNTVVCKVVINPFPQTAASSCLS
jgi:hypothetical protein